MIAIDKLWPHKVHLIFMAYPIFIKKIIEIDKKSNAKTSFLIYYFQLNHNNCLFIVLLYLPFIVFVGSIEHNQVEKTDLQ